MTLRIQRGAAVALTPVLSSCGGDSSASQSQLPITISVAPTSDTVPAGTTQDLTATLQNDSSRQGVTWTISPTSGAGTLSHATSTSVTYNAPPSAPDRPLTDRAPDYPDAQITLPQQVRGDGPRGSCREERQHELQQESKCDHRH